MNATAVQSDPDYRLVGGLPRPAVVVSETPVKVLPDIDTLAVDLARVGFHPWLRFDGEEWVCELTCGAETPGWPSNRPRPIGRGMTALKAMEAAMGIKREMEER